MIGLHRTFGALLAESAASEKVFYKSLEEKSAQPAAVQGPDSKIATKNSGDSVPWENPIDFSR
jgi:hypothetical protein